jgi:hypothetical protein
MAFTLSFCSSTMSLLLITGIWNLPRWAGLQWHIVHTEFSKNLLKYFKKFKFGTYIDRHCVHRIVISCSYSYHLNNILTNKVPRKYSIIYSILVCCMYTIGLVLVVSYEQICRCRLKTDTRTHNGDKLQLILSMSVTCTFTGNMDYDR